MSKESACSLRTKAKMTQALKELMTEVPFEKITVSAIVEKCGIHRQTFYYHFQDRYELLDSIINEELVDPFIRDFKLENMYDKFYDLLSTMYNEQDFYINALKINSSELSEYIMDRTEKEFTSLLRTIRKDENIDVRAEENDYILAQFLGFGLSGVIVTWAKDGMKKTPQEMTDNVVRLMQFCKKIALQGRE